MRNKLALLLLLTACQGKATPSDHSSALAPSHVEHAVAESELPVVRLAPAALRRLGIQTGKVEESTLPSVRLVGGEVIVPPGRSISVSAPVGGMVQAASNEAVLAPGTAVRRGDVLLRLVPLAPVDRDLRARAERERAVARAQLDAAQARLTRLTQLQAEQASSQRLVEDATANRDVAKADMQAAEARVQSTQGAALLADVTLTVRAPESGVVRSLSAVPGQVLAPGAALLEIAAVDALQVRVPVYAGDLARLDVQAPSRVRALSASIAESREARPVAGPPTADPLAATVDRYYTLAPGGASFSPGERVLVELALRTVQSERTLPASAVVYDAQGAAWVYACAGEGRFRRERVDPVRRSGAALVFARGPVLGTCVASVGAAEIFGSEFEPGH